MERTRFSIFSVSSALSDKKHRQSELLPIKYTAILSILWAASTSVHAGNIDVILLSGQSNAVGIASYADFTDPARKKLVQSGFGGELKSVPAATNAGTQLMPLMSTAPSSFGAELFIAHWLINGSNQYYSIGKNRVAMLKDAVSGVPLTGYWDANGPGMLNNYLPSMVKKIQQQYPNDTVRVKAVVWIQGESDVLAGTVPVYEAALKKLAQNLFNNYPNAKWVSVGLGSHQTYLSLAGRTALNDVFKKIAATDARFHYIDNTTPNMHGDALHYNGLGLDDIGHAVAVDLLRTQVMGVDAP